MLEAWSGRQYTDPDGISYLDMSDALILHTWHLLINPYWSPLYPFVIGVATWITRPSGYWELPIVHLVNFAIFLGALASFEFLIRQVISVRGQDIGQPDEHSAVPLPVWIWQLLGYSLFATTTFVLMNGVRRVSPDLCVATFLYLDAGLLLRLRTGIKRSRTCLLLGITLGLGYLAKAVLFPMAFVFIAMSFVMVGKVRKAVLPLATTIVVFSAVASPLVVSISKIVGRPSFSEAGSLNVAWQINWEYMLPFYRSGPPYMKHPMDLLHNRPKVFGFAQSQASTYPPWGDPQYWNAGANTAFNGRACLRAIGRNIAALVADIYMIAIWVLIAGGSTFYFMSPAVLRRFQHLSRAWPLFVPGIAGLLMYVLVVVVPRLIAPFAVLILLGCFPAILLQKPDDTAKRSAITTLVIAASVMTLTALIIVLHLAFPLPTLRGPGGVHYQAAESLNREGLRSGDAVAIIGSGWDGMIWARLARLRIICQIPPEEAVEFWRASDPRAKAEVYDAFAKAGARAVVTEETPPSEGFADWQRVGETQYFVHFLALSTRQ